MKEQCEEEEEVRSRSDGISELPDSLILHILGLLPTADAIRTTILSKRWRNLWTTIPFLEFNDCTKKFIDGVVNSWRGMKLWRFKLEVRYQSMEVDEWVQFAVEKKVEELELVLDYPHMLSWAIHHVCSCSSLKKLTLIGYCDDEIHGNVRWDQLKELMIILGVGLTESAVNQVLCDSPQLEHLTLSFANNVDNLSIRSTSLKKLVIANFLYDRNDFQSTELKIWAPNLETLTMNNKYSMMSIASLTHVGLWIETPPTYPFPGNDFIGDKLNQILPTIKHVPRVTMTDSCAKVLAAMREKLTIPPFPNANHLGLRVCFEEYEQIIGVVEMFPQLRYLYLETTIKTVGESCLEFDRNLPSSFLLQLRKVDVLWPIDDNSIFPLIRILLKYARNLDELCLQVKRTGSSMPSELCLMAKEKVMRMERSSPTARLYIQICDED